MTESVLGSARETRELVTRQDMNHWDQGLGDNVTIGAIAEHLPHEAGEYFLYGRDNYIGNGIGL